MPSAFIITRVTSTGQKRYFVRYRLGGRTYPLQHAGSYRTLRDARVRRDFVIGEITAGRNPAVTPAATTTPTAPTMTVGRWTEKFIASRLDIDGNTKKNYTSILKKVSARFGDRDPAGLGGDDVAEWVAELAGTLKPGTVQLH